MSLRVLIVHNAYIHRGGEEVVVENETQALKEAGMDVHTFHPKNSSGWKTALNAIQAPIGGGIEEDIEKLLRNLKPDILHAHNLFPQLSPRLFATAKQIKIRTVQTFHNFRPLCLNGLFLTPQGEVCERCAGGNFFPGIQRGCYRESASQSAVMAAHLGWARKKGWYDAADRYVTPSHFLRNKFVKNGFPEEKFSVQGNFLTDFPEYRYMPPEPYLIFMGRLSEEKGLSWLLQQFSQPPLPIQLQIAGSGPLYEKVMAATGPHVQFLGFIKGEEKHRLIRQALALVLPSECYENYPMAVLEANALGIPAIVPNQGGMAEMVQPGINGARYTAHDPASFWHAVKAIFEQTDARTARQHCRTHAEEYFSKATFLKARMALYTSLTGVTL